MVMHRLYGHGPLSDRLGTAIVSGRFPQVVLFSGPSGVGKQRLALWAAQSLLCEGQSPPCGTCRPCTQVLDLQHPDLLWFVPLVITKRSLDADRMVDEAADTLADILASRRDNPLYGPPEPKASHSIASVRMLQRSIANRPFQGNRRVVILGDADRLVVQAASLEAANSLLKVLEEPPAGTTLILTSSSPKSLLPTIRSRVVPIRVGPVQDHEVREFLGSVVGQTGRELDAAVTRAGGRIGLAAGQNTDAARADRAARGFLKAVNAGAEAWGAASLSQPPWGAREFTATLDAIAHLLRGRLRDKAEHALDMPRYLGALRLVERKRLDAQQNVNPQLALAVLAVEMQRLR